MSSSLRKEEKGCRDILASQWVYRYGSLLFFILYVMPKKRKG
jgi:hypothetical protein